MRRVWTVRNDHFSLHNNPEERIALESTTSLRNPGNYVQSYTPEDLNHQQLRCESLVSGKKDVRHNYELSERNLTNIPRLQNSRRMCCIDWNDGLVLHKQLYFLIITSVAKIITFLASVCSWHYGHYIEFAHMLFDDAGTLWIHPTPAIVRKHRGRGSPLIGRFTDSRSVFIPGLWHWVRSCVKSRSSKREGKRQAKASNE